MKIESIKLRNFKSFRDAEMSDIPKFCVVVGANGSGKTTLFDVFGFLKDCLTFNVRHAMQSRGGISEMRSRGAGESESIDIEVKFRLDISGIERLVTYSLSIGSQEGSPLVEAETLEYDRGSLGLPYKFLNFKRGQGYAISNEEEFNRPDEELEKEEQSLQPDVLAIKGLGQFRRFNAASAFRELIENWYVSDFYISAARGSKDAVGYDEHLSVTGDNLSLVARNIYENHPEIFEKIVLAMKKRVPGISEIQPLATEDGRLILKFQDGSFADPFIDRYVSDGTIKMFAYLVLLYDPSPHPLLCVEEPENQLYPKLLGELAEEFRSYTAKGGQVFVSTHSPDFLNAVELEEVFWLAKEGGYSKMYRAQDNKQIAEYMKGGDQMGYLWKQGFFEGIDPR